MESAQTARCRCSARHVKQPGSSGRGIYRSRRRTRMIQIHCHFRLKPNHKTMSELTDRESFVEAEREWASQRINEMPKGDDDTIHLDYVVDLCDAMIARHAGMQAAIRADRGGRTKEVRIRELEGEL